MGVLITLEPPTRPMIEEAAAAGFYHSPLWQLQMPRIQIFTVEELLKEKKTLVPSQINPYRQAARLKTGSEAQQAELKL